MPIYIDRDEAKKILFALKDECYKERANHNIIIGIIYAINELNKVSIKEVSEVKKGKWIKAPCSEKDGDANCSCCGRWDWSDCNYCASCGSKMN